MSLGVFNFDNSEASWVGEIVWMINIYIIKLQQSQQSKNYHIPERERESKRENKKQTNNETTDVQKTIQNKPYLKHKNKI